MNALRSTSSFSHLVARTFRCNRSRYPIPRNDVFGEPFSSSARQQIKTKDIGIKEWKTLKVDRERLWRELHETCEWGKGERWGKKPTDVGMSRLSLSDADKQARDWFVSTTKSLGCKVHVDEMGNIFAIRPGMVDGPATFAGSHLDTQPTGGRYDGILGVHAGIEALRTMNDNNVETIYPTGVVNWTNEEGARFPVSMAASGVWAGEIPLEKAYNLQEVGGGTSTQKSELERIGYLGTVPADHKKGIPIGAHFELHIEQGPILESTGGKVGVVKGVQAYRWFTITVQGRDCHTGTTDFKNRSDALLMASKMIVQSHDRAALLGCLASTGILNLKPGSMNTVPGWVQFGLDIRSRSDSKLAELEEALRSDFETIARGKVPGLGGEFFDAMARFFVNQDESMAESMAGFTGQMAEIMETQTARNMQTTYETTEEMKSIVCGMSAQGCTVSWETVSVSPAISFHKDCISCVEMSAASLLQSEPNPKGNNLVQDMISGAGHDSVYVSKKSPTSMIFVPCRDGVSHHPAEYCSKEDCGNGADVLLGAMLRYDLMRAKRTTKGAK